MAKLTVIDDDLDDGDDGPMIELVPLPKARLVGSLIRFRRQHMTISLPFILVCAVLSDMLARFEKNLSLVPLVAFALYLLVWGIIEWPRIKANKTSLPHRTERTGHARLSCRGHPNDLAALHNVRGFFFEPVIIPRALHLSARASARWALVASMAAVVGCKYFHMPLWKYAFVLVGLLCSPLLLQWFRPSYYRVVPGRLEMMSFSFLSRQPRSMQTISLCDAVIACRYDEGLLVIHQANHKPPSLSIDLVSLADPCQFVKAVFDGALCQITAPPLPTDRFI